MRCPKCGGLDDKVVDSRSIKDGQVVRRRRVCKSCGHRYMTYEEAVKSSLVITKRDGRREDFDRNKLLNGVLRACEKRPISIQQVESLVENVTNELYSEYEREVPSTAIGEKVMAKLEQLDEVAYVRFASVYRRFRDVNQFLSEVEGLIRRD